MALGLWVLEVLAANPFVAVSRGSVTLKCGLKIQVRYKCVRVQESSEIGVSHGGMYWECALYSYD